MKQLTIVMVVLALAALLGTGCQESDASQIRRARLVANENLQLKKELKEKDEQIENLKKEIEKIETESAKKVEQAGETSIKTMQLLMESEKQNEVLQLENEKLKEELESLKTQ